MDLFHDVFRSQKTRRAADHIDPVSIKATAAKDEAHISECLHCIVKLTPRALIVIAAFPKNRYPLLRPQRNAQLRATGFKLKSRGTEPAVELRVGGQVIT